MEPRAELKGELAEVSGFVQNSPKDGQAATPEDGGLRGVHADGAVRGVLCASIPIRS